eukprot:3363984-Prymnesium_polylepis.2
MCEPPELAERHAPFRERWRFCSIRSASSTESEITSSVYDASWDGRCAWMQTTYGQPGSAEKRIDGWAASGASPSTSPFSQSCLRTGCSVDVSRTGSPNASEKSPTGSIERVEPSGSGRVSPSAAAASSASDTGAIIEAAICMEEAPS